MVLCARERQYVRGKHAGTIYRQKERMRGKENKGEGEVEVKQKERERSERERAIEREERKRKSKRTCAREMGTYEISLRREGSAVNWSGERKATLRASPRQCCCRSGHVEATPPADSR